MVWHFLTTSVALKQKSTQSDKEGVCYYFTHAEKMGQRAVQPITMWKSLYEVVHQRLVNRLNHIGSGSLSTGIVFALKYYLFSFSMSAWRLLDNICSFHVLEILLLVCKCITTLNVSVKQMVHIKVSVSCTISVTMALHSSRWQKYHQHHAVQP